MKTRNHLLPPKYDINKFINELRDKYIPCLMRQLNKKLDLGQVRDQNELIQYVNTLITNTLESRLSQKEVQKIESLKVKFLFLPHDKNNWNNTDDILHGIAYQLLALCNGYKPEVEKFISRITSSMLILDHRRLDLAGIKGTYLDDKTIDNLCDEVAELTRKCMRDFLQELRETGKIMTSAEVAELYLAEPKDYPDDFETRDIDTNDSTSAKSTKNTYNSCKETNERASLESVTGDENDTKEESKDSSHSDENNSDYNMLLDYFLSWIYELPEWLQDKILNSNPVKTLIEKTKQTSAIYDLKSISNWFTNLFANQEINKEDDILEDKMYEKVKTIDLTDNKIDMTMVLGEHKVNAWILPTVAIESGSIFGNYDSNGLENFNGLNGIDIF